MESTLRIIGRRFRRAPDLSDFRKMMINDGSATGRTTAILGVNNRRWKVILAIVQILALQPIDMFAVRCRGRGIFWSNSNIYPTTVTCSPQHQATFDAILPRRGMLCSARQN